MEFEHGQIAYYIEGNTVRSGHVVDVAKPAEKDGEPLYSFGHGVSVPTVYTTQKEAQEALTKEQDLA